MTLTIEQMQKLKKKFGLSYQEVAEASGVPIGTVQKVLGGITGSPRHATLEELTAGFRKLVPESVGADASAVSDAVFEYNGGPEETDDSDEEVLRKKAEELLASKSQGEFTVDDYYVISEVWRIELIDGEIYDMAAPTFSHQHIAGSVYAQMMSFLMSDEHDCLPGIAPIDVQLDCDEDTMVQPDLIVLCDREKNHNKKVYGAPDFVMEVISPSSRMKDSVKKRDKYRDAGCREYWLVDPVAERVKVYGFESEVDGLYTFEQKIPVQISNGKCEIDFRMVKDQLKRYNLYSE